MAREVISAFDMLAALVWLAVPETLRHLLGGRLPTVTLSATGRRWAVSTPHHRATQTAAEVFSSGGNALDAALVAATTLAVVYPHMCGVGGDLFALVAQPGGEVVAVNASGRAGSLADADAARAAENGAMPLHGPHSVTVPGAVGGWAALQRLGATLPWPRLFEAAITAAEQGVEVSSSLAQTLADDAERLRRDPGMAVTFFDAGGGPLGRGALLRQPELATTLHALAEGGADAWYRGELGAAYVDGLASLGCSLTHDDLARNTAHLGAPLAGHYGELEVLVHPPNSPGFSLLQILALAHDLVPDADPFGPGAADLAAIFAAAWSERDQYLADLATMTVDASELISGEHVRALASGLRQSVDSRPVRGGSGDTIALVTVDADGRAVSLIQSLYDGFGSGLLEPQTGVVAQNRGACFTAVPGQANTLTPGRRPAHTLMPAMVSRGRRLAAVSGSMGGLAQPQINALTLLHMFGRDEHPAAAVAAPRWLIGGADADDERPGVLAESDVPEATLTLLRDAGWPVEVIPPRSSEVGHAHAIRCTDDGFDVGCDPRSDGSAAAG